MKARIGYLGVKDLIELFIENSKVTMIRIKWLMMQHNIDISIDLYAHAWRYQRGNQNP